VQLILCQTIPNAVVKDAITSSRALLTECARGRDLSKVISDTDDERAALAPASIPLPSFSFSSSSTITQKRQSLIPINKDVFRLYDFEVAASFTMSFPY